MNRLHKLPPRRIGCDLDGVIADLELPIQQAIERQFGVPINEQKRDNFYMHERFDIEPQVMDQFMDDLFNQPTFWGQASPIEHNIRPLRDLGLGQQLVFITGRHGHARQETEEWLYRQGIYHFDLLMHTLGNKHLAMKFSGAEMFIEDRYEEATRIASYEYRSYLVRTHYNKMFEGKNDWVIWVEGVADALAREGL